MGIRGKMFLTEVEKRRGKETEFVPAPEELVRSFFENVLPARKQLQLRSPPLH